MNSITLIFKQNQYINMKYLSVLALIGIIFLTGCMHDLSFTEEPIENFTEEIPFEEPVKTDKTNDNKNVLSDSSKTNQGSIDSAKTNPPDSTNTNQQTAGKPCITSDNEAFVMGLSIKKRMGILTDFQNMYPDQKDSCPG